MIVVFNHREVLILFCCHAQGFLVLCWFQWLAFWAVGVFKHFQVHLCMHCTGNCPFRAHFPNHCREGLLQGVVHSVNRHILLLRNRKRFLLKTDKRIVKVQVKIQGMRQLYGKFSLTDKIAAPSLQNKATHFNDIRSFEAWPYIKLPPHPSPHSRGHRGKP